jgi:hypothetical protein
LVFLNDFLVKSFKSAPKKSQGSLAVAVAFAVAVDVAGFCSSGTLRIGLGVGLSESHNFYEKREKATFSDVCLSTAINE